MKAVASQSRVCCSSTANPAANGPSCCPPGCCEQVESIRSRRVLRPAERKRLAQLFKVLANDTRLLMLHVLIKHGELAVNDLASELDMTAQAVSNQLQKLAALRIVESRRAGNSIYYRVVDPCVTMLFDLGLCLLEDKRAGSRRQAASS